MFLKTLWQWTIDIFKFQRKLSVFRNIELLLTSLYIIMCIENFIERTSYLSAWIKKILNSPDSTSAEQNWFLGLIWSDSISLTEWMSVRLRIKWLWVQVPLQSLTIPVSNKEFLYIQATKECGFTLKRLRNMIRTYI